MTDSESRQDRDRGTVPVAVIGRVPWQVQVSQLLQSPGIQLEVGLELGKSVLLIIVVGLAGFSPGGCQVKPWLTVTP